MWIVTGLLGCSENGLSYAKPVETCASEYWPEEPTAPADPSLWEMQELWHARLGGGIATQMMASAFEDTNHDGAVGLGDRIDVVAQALSFGADSGYRVWHVDGETGAETELYSTEFGIAFAIADVDGANPGPEIVIADGKTVSIADPTGVYLEVTVPDLRETVVLLATDLDGDGLVELAATNGVFDFATGEQRFAIDPKVDSLVAADLDGDGSTELIASGGRGVPRILDADGDPIGTCSHPNGVDSPAYRLWSVAVGNLDADPELEVVTGSEDGLAVCDRDGTVIATNDLTAGYGGFSVAQLDGDPEAEIVVPNGGAYIALNHDLTALSTEGATPLVGTGLGHSVADLDGDGIHEILTVAHTYLAVVRTTGTPVAFYPLPGFPFLQGFAVMSPMMADIDGDGAAEMVVGEFANSGLTALENVHHGWDVVGADRPWTSVDYHPDSMGPGGEVGRVDPAGVAAGHNVWNGRPVTAPECSKVVTLEVREVCIDRCDGDANLIVYVHNAGVLPVSSGVALELRVDGDVIETQPLPDVPAETAVPVQLVVPASRLNGAIEVQLGGSAATGCAVPTATWDEPLRCE